VAGLLYIFMQDQPKEGKAFWIIVIILMLMLGSYWTATIYINWQQQPGKTFL
jgi:hypothetical protein